LVAPLTKEGLPAKLYFKASSAQHIINSIKSYSQANYVIAIVAKPTTKGKITFNIYIYIGFNSSKLIKNYNSLTIKEFYGFLQKIPFFQGIFTLKKLGIH
jgi:hypothetical protein